MIVPQTKKDMQTKNAFNIKRTSILILSQFFSTYIFERILHKIFNILINLFSCDKI